MKIVFLGAFLLFLAAFAPGENAPAFEIKSYSPEDGIVKIKIGSETTNRPFGSFSAEEQQRINGWLSDKEFLSSTRLRITVEKQKERDDIYSTDVTPNRFKGGVNGKTIEKISGESRNVSYIMKLENGSATAFRNLEIEYRVFYEENEGAVSTKKCAFGTATRPTLLPGEEWSIETPAIEIRSGIKESTSVAWKGTNIMSSQAISRSGSVQDRLRGACFLVTKLGGNGERIEREYQTGLVPDKKDRPDYQQATSVKKALEVPPGSSVIGKTFSEEQIQQYTKRAKDGNYMSSLVLCEYYYGQGDQKNTKYWAEQVKRLIKSRPKGPQEEAEARLAAIGQL